MESLPKWLLAAFLYKVLTLMFAESFVLDLSHVSSAVFSGTEEETYYEEIANRFSLNSFSLKFSNGISPPRAGPAPHFPIMMFY